MLLELGLAAPVELSNAISDTWGAGQTCMTVSQLLYNKAQQSATGAEQFPCQQLLEKHVTA